MKQQTAPHCQAEYVMRGGTLQQLGPPRDVYEDPANVFVAGFLGSPPINMWFYHVGPQWAKRLLLTGDTILGRDAARIARELAPAVEDWRSVLSTNTTGSNPDPLAGFQESCENQRRQIERSAQQLLAKADSLHVDFSKGAFRAEAIPPRQLGQSRNESIMAADQWLASADKLEIVLLPDSGGVGPTNGEFKLAVLRLMKLPGGWRSRGGVQWVSFPSDVADPKTAREVAKAVSRWRREAAALGILAPETEIVASAFEHEDLALAKKLRT